MSLTTPRKIRELQIKLYRKAKSEPDYRFYLLYDKIYGASGYLVDDGARSRPPQWK
jgi:hypothetical protein